MGVERLEVLTRDPIAGKVQKRVWTKSELLKSIAWLKRMNARGSNIYVWPEEQHALALIGGLSAEQLAAMRQKGLPPAITVETEGGTYQAWVKLSKRPITDQIRQLAAQRLANAFGGAPRRDEQTHGLLAGFTVNEGPSSADRQRRFALAGIAHLGVSPLAAQVLEQIETGLHEQSRRRRSLGRRP